MRRRLPLALTLVAGLGAIACDGDGPIAPAVPRAEPAEGASTGYVTLDLVLPADLPAAEVEGVWVGPRRALLPEVLAPDRVRVLVQGSPTPGPAEVVVETAAGPRSLGPIYSYRPPLDPRFERVVAFGASLTQGVQGGVPAFDNATQGPAALVARQLGADLPLPLLVPDLFAGITPALIGPPPACAIPQVTDVVATQTADLLPRLQPEGGGTLTGRPARLDPDLAPHNLAVGGSQLRHHVHGADTLGTRVVARLVYSPDGRLLGPVDEVPLSLLVALSPTLVISTDLFDNDLAAPLILTDDLDPASATALDELAADLDLLLPTLAETGAVSFLGNMPRPSLLPATYELKARLVEAAEAAGEDPAAAAAEADDRIAAIDAHAVAANALLAERAAGFPTVHVVDVAGAVAALEATGLVVGEHTLTVHKFGGLLGLDGIHFTDAGYGFLANLFIDAINAELGTTAPRLDLAPIVAADPERADRLAAAGLGGCE